MSDLPQVRSSAAALLQAGQQQVEVTSGGGGFLKFDSKRTGDWLFGAAGDIVTDDLISLDTLSLKHGYILWHNRKADRRMVPISAKLPEPQEPITYTDAKGKEQVDEANEARSFEASFADGQGLTFEVSTYGGRQAVDKILTELFARAAAGSPYLYPHVRLESDSYDHPSYGTVYTPVMNPVAWYDEEGNPDPANEGDTPKLEAVDNSVEEEPQADEPQAEAPQRQRRKRRGE